MIAIEFLLLLFPIVAMIIQLPVYPYGPIWSFLVVVFALRRVNLFLNKRF